MSQITYVCEQMMSRGPNLHSVLFYSAEVLLLLDEVLSAAVDVKTLVSVQEFLQVSEGDMHMHGFFDQQGGGVACMVKDSCLVSERLVVCLD